MYREFGSRPSLPCDLFHVVIAKGREQGVIATMSAQSAALMLHTSEQGVRKAAMTLVHRARSLIKAASSQSPITLDTLEMSVTTGLSMPPTHPHARTEPQNRHTGKQESFCTVQ